MIVTAHSDTRRARLWLVGWLAYWVLAFAVTHAPIRGLPTPRFEGADKVVHFLLYFGLTWLGCRAIGAWRGRLGVKPAILLALLFSAYGVADEWLQGFVGRTPSRYDWFADLAGIAAATTWMLIRFPRRVSPA